MREFSFFLGVEGGCCVGLEAWIQNEGISSQRGCFEKVLKLSKLRFAVF